jgi:hypothetical protein
MFSPLIARCLLHAPRAPSAVSSSTWNPADIGADITLSNGNKTATRASGTGDSSVRGTLSNTAGYFEVTVTVAGNPVIGLDIGTLALNDFPGDNPTSVGYASSGAVFNNAGSIGGTFASYTTGDVIGVCQKADKIYFSKNGTWQNGADPSAGTGGITPSGSMTTVFPIIDVSAVGAAGELNTGGSAFSGTLPTGVAAWG